MYGTDGRIFGWWVSDVRMKEMIHWVENRRLRETRREC
jgi:hypothetical protein